MFDAIMGEGYRTPPYLTEGQEVLIPFRRDGKLYGLKCKVTIAAGDAGRVLNEKYGVDKWVQRDDMAEAKQPK